MLSESERSAILDQEIRRYTAQGFRVTSRTATTAQMLKPKQFNVAVAVLGLLVFVVGLLVYLLIYLGQSDETLYLTVGEDGRVQRSGNARALGRQGVDRWICEACGYGNHRARSTCKRCHAGRPALAP